MRASLREKKAEKRLLQVPSIRIYNSTECLGTVATHINNKKIPGEGQYRSVPEADRALILINNRDSCRFDANPLSSRFAKMLESL
jgi:hypothetical protein